MSGISFPHAFNTAIIVPGRRAFNTAVDATLSAVDATMNVLDSKCRSAYLDKIGMGIFRFFKSYGNEPKDLAKVVSVTGAWTAAICEDRGAFTGWETAKKVSDFAKQAKCFLSFAGIWKQSAKIVNELSVFRARKASQVPSEVLIQLEDQPPVQNNRDHFLVNIFTLSGLKALIGSSSTAYSAIFDSISLFSALGLVSSKTRFFEVMKTGNCMATILGASLRFGKEGYQLHGQYGQGGFRSTSTLKSTIQLLEHAFVFALGALPFTPWFKECSVISQSSTMLRLSTATVITNLFHKHIPASLGFQQATDAN